MLRNFYEVVAAPDFDSEALKILKKKVNLRVLKVKKYKIKIEQWYIFAGMLIQQANNKKSTIKKVYGVNRLNNEKINFFSNVIKAVKSNDIAIFVLNTLLS